MQTDNDTPLDRSLALRLDVSSANSERHEAVLPNAGLVRHKPTGTALLSGTRYVSPAQRLLSTQPKPIRNDAAEAIRASETSWTSPN
jgi:hypothetical protein